jgi:TolB protein
VFAYNAGGIGHLRQWSTTGITTLLQLDHTIASPQWSPNGNQILFTTYEENVWLWVVDADGRNASRLINGQRLERPVWSPDGSYIAFVAFRANSAAIELELIKSDGSCHTVLTSDLFSSTEPAWSPDGRQIAFVAKKKLEVANHLFVMNVDGSQRRQITTEEARYSAPTWSPDGHYLAYVQKHIVQNKWTVYVLDMRDPDAQPQKIGLGSHPAWQPQP